MIECTRCGRDVTGKSICPVCRTRVPGTATASSSADTTPQRRQPWSPPVPAPDRSAPAPREPGDRPSAAARPVPASVATTAQGGQFTGRVVSKSEMYTEVVDLRKMNSVAAIPGQMVGGLFRGFGFVLAIIFAPVRWLLLPFMFGGRGNRSQPTDEVAIQVRSFRVTSPSGETRECQLRGNLRGGFVEIGDEVRVTGSTSKATGSLILASTIENVATGQLIRAELPPQLRNANVRAVAGGVAGIAFLVFLILLLSSCGRMVGMW